MPQAYTKWQTSMKGSAREGTAREEGTWRPGTPADWVVRRLARCKDAVRGGHRPPLWTPKQLTSNQNPQELQAGVVGLGGLGYLESASDAYVAAVAGIG